MAHNRGESRSESLVLCKQNQISKFYVLIASTASEEEFDNFNLPPAGFDFYRNMCESTRVFISRRNIYVKKHGGWNCN